MGTRRLTHKKKKKKKKKTKSEERDNTDKALALIEGLGKTERRLPRVTRTILFQLRSGRSNSLNSYRARIIPGTPNSCSSCNQALYDTTNFFNCPTKPTLLQPIDLWLNPISTADLLGLPTS